MVRSPAQQDIRESLLEEDILYKVKYLFYLILYQCLQSPMASCSLVASMFA